MLSVAPMDFDYFAFQEAYNAKLPEYNAGVLSDLNANSIYVVEDYPDKQSQLAQYLFTVSMVAGKRQTLSPNMTVKLAEAYETFDGQQTQTAKSGGELVTMSCANGMKDTCLRAKKAFRISFGSD